MVLRQNAARRGSTPASGCFSPITLNWLFGSLRGSAGRDRSRQRQTVNIRLSRQPPSFPRPLDVFSAKCMHANLWLNSRNALERNSICRPDPSAQPTDHRSGSRKSPRMKISRSPCRARRFGTREVAAARGGASMFARRRVGKGGPRSHGRGKPHLLQAPRRTAILRRTLRHGPGQVLPETGAS